MIRLCSLRLCPFLSREERAEEGGGLLNHHIHQEPLSWLVFPIE